MTLSKQKLWKSAMLGTILMFSIAALGVILFGVNQFKIGSQLAGINQVSNLSHVLVRQQANLFSMLLGENPKLPQLIENLDNFTKEAFVIDAAVYSKNGELLAQSTNTANLREMLGPTQEKGSDTVRQIVEPIYVNAANADIAGFLRVTFDSRYGQTTQNKINRLFHHLYGELLIVFILGALLASSVHYFLNRYRRLQPHLSNITTDPPATTAAQRYHRRRKRR